MYKIVMSLVFLSTIIQVVLYPVQGQGGTDMTSTVVETPTTTVDAISTTVAAISTTEAAMATTDMATSTTETNTSMATTSTVTTTTQVTQAAQSSFCVSPLVFSTHQPNPISDAAKKEGQTGPISLTDCGLKCEKGALVYGLSDNEQRAVDGFKVGGTVAIFLALLFLFLNQSFDQAQSNQSFWSKPLIYHIPYCISISVFFIMLLMTAGEIAGKSAILCNDDDNSFSFWNPGIGKNGGCTAHAFFFYGALMFYFWYTVLLGFAIFRQFYNPLNPFWNIPKWVWHAGVVVVVMSFEIAGLSTDSIDGIWPMGVCLPGPSKKDLLLAYIVIPTTICTCLVFIFLIGCLILMRMNIIAQKKVTNTGATAHVADLARRMLWYTVGVMMTMILLTATTWVFWKNHGPLREAMNEQISCELTNEYVARLYAAAGVPYTPKACERTKTLNPFWFISWIISCASAVSAQLVLSCHAKNRSRLQTMTSKILDDINLSKKKTEDFDEEAKSTTKQRDARKITAYDPQIELQKPSSPDGDGDGDGDGDIPRSSSMFPDTAMRVSSLFPEGINDAQTSEQTGTHTSLEVQPNDTQSPTHSPNVGTSDDYSQT